MQAAPGHWPDAPCKGLDDSDSSPFRRPGEPGYGDRLRARVFGTDGCGPAVRGNPQIAPEKDAFRLGRLGCPRRGRSVPPLFCRVRGAARGAVGKEKGRLKNLSPGS